jgi:hypothetical protein
MPAQAGNLGREVAILLSLAIENEELMGNLRKEYQELKHLTEEDFISTFRARFRTEGGDALRAEIEKLQRLGLKHKEVGDIANRMYTIVERAQRKISREKGVEVPFEKISDALASTSHEAAVASTQLKELATAIDRVQQIQTGKIPEGKLRTRYLEQAKDLLRSTGTSDLAEIPSTVNSEQELADMLLPNLQDAQKVVGERLRQASDDLQEEAKDLSGRDRQLMERLAADAKKTSDAVIRAHEITPERQKLEGPVKEFPTVGPAVVGRGGGKIFVTETKALGDASREAAQEINKVAGESTREAKALRAQAKAAEIAAAAEAKLAEIERRRQIALKGWATRRRKEVEGAAAGYLGGLEKERGTGNVIERELRRQASEQADILASEQRKAADAEAARIKREAASAIGPEGFRTGRPEFETRYVRGFTRITNARKKLYSDFFTDLDKGQLVLDDMAGSVENLIQQGKIATLDTPLSMRERYKVKTYDRGIRQVDPARRKVELDALARKRALTVEEKKNVKASEVAEKATKELANARKQDADAAGKQAGATKGVDQSLVAYARKIRQSTIETVKSDRARKSALRNLVERRGGLLGAAGFATGRLGFYAIAAGAIYGTIAAFKSAISTAVELQQAMAEIQAVLPTKSQLEALEIKEVAIDAAKRYGANLREVADSAKIFAQTGQSVEEIANSINATMLAVRGANLPLEQARELIIAIRNITQGEVEALSILDRISRVESRRAITATDLAIAIQRIGPLVRQLRGDMTGMVDEFDIAMGAVTSIVERTRVSGVNAATSLRFILSRLARPEIIRRIQELSGVGVARAGGRQLRPFSEILTEISFAYQRLIEQGQSGRAFELLGAIGGARQLQATAAVLENFSRDSIGTARLSALALNDTLERSNIALNTISASAAKAGAAWGGFADALTTIGGPVVKGGLDLLGGLGNTLETITRAVTDAYDRITGINRRQIDFISADELAKDQIPQLQRLVALARESDVSTQKIVDRVLKAAQMVGAAMEINTGFTRDQGGLQGLLDLLDTGETGDQFRTLYETYGKQLVTLLSPVIKGIDDYNAKIAETADPTEKAKLQTEQLTLAMETLGDVVYTTNSIIITNADRAKEALTSLVNDVGSELQRVRQIGLKPLDTHEWSLFYKQFDQDLRPFIQTMYDGIITSEQLGQAIRDNLVDINPLTEERPWGGVTPLGARLMAWTGLDRLLDVQQGVDWNGVIAQLETWRQGFEDTDSVIDHMATTLKERLIEQGFSLPTSMLEGIDRAVSSTNLLAKAANQVFEEFAAAGQQDSPAAQVALYIDQILNHPGSRTAEYLTTMERGFTNVKQKLLDLIGAFIVAVDSANKLNDAYGRIGLSFDKQETIFNATKTLFEGLSKVQNELRKDIIATEAQARGAQSILQDLAGRVGKDLSDLDLTAENVGIEQIAEALEGRAAQSVERLTSKLQDLRAQLKETDAVSLSEMFGDSESGREFLRIFDEFISGTTENTRNLAESIWNFAQLTGLVEEALKTQNQARIQRQLELTALKAQVTLVKQLGQEEVKRRDYIGEIAKQQLDLYAGIEQRLLGSRRLEEGLLESRLRKEQQVYNIERRQVSDTSAIKRRALEQELSAIEERLAAETLVQDSTVQNYEYITKLEEERSRILEERRRLGVEEFEQLEKLANTLSLANERIILENLTDKFLALEQQIQNNIQSATSGLKQVLTDFNSFNTRPVETLLSSISGTFIERTADSFVDSLINAQTEGLLGSIIRFYAETPEARMRQQLQTALEAAGKDIAIRFTDAGRSFNDRLAVILGQDVSTGIAGPEALTSQKDFVRLIGAASTGNFVGMFSGMTGYLKTVAENTDQPVVDDTTFREMAQQFTTLAAAIGGAYAGGGGRGAQLGGQTGTILGQAGGEAIGNAIGGTLGSFAGPFGTVAGGVIGGILGGIFDKDKEKKKQTASLKRIEASSRESVDILELQRQLMEVSRGAFNVPSTFTLPQYTPGGLTSPVGQQNNTFEMTINVSSNNPDRVVEVIREQFGPMLQQELGKIGV